MNALPAPARPVSAGPQLANVPGTRHHPHPMSIASYLKDIGRGAQGARALGRDDARELMRRVLGGETSGAQVGAFLMAMRMKGELSLIHI